MKKESRCDNCVYWISHTPGIVMTSSDGKRIDVGDCRKNPPVVEGGWPTTVCSSWCGAWAGANCSCAIKCSCIDRDKNTTHHKPLR